MSAPVAPGVDAAMRSRSTSAASGTERVWILRISMRPGRSGGWTAMRRSKRPGRRRAWSRTSGRFVAPSTITFVPGSKPSEDPHGPVLRAVLTHRAWFYALIRDTFASAGHTQPDLAAAHYVMLRDGATTAGHLGDPSQARETFERALTGLLRFTDNPPTADDAPEPAMASRE
jgi:hypothetical protein